MDDELRYFRCTVLSNCGQTLISVICPFDIKLFDLLKEKPETLYVKGHMPTCEVIFRYAYRVNIQREPNHFRIAGVKTTMWATVESPIILKLINKYMWLGARCDNEDRLKIKRRGEFKDYMKCHSEINI